MNEQLNKYLENGWKIFPIVKRDKNPLTEHGLLDASNDRNQIEKWIEKFPECNWGLATGEIIVIDIDPKNGGDSKSIPLTRTLIVKTGSGGHHFYYKNPGYDIRNSASKLAKGIDVRGIGGYVVLPPSIHPNGNKYEWLNDKEIEVLPEGIYKLLSDENKESFQLPKTIPEGERNTDLFSLGCSLRGKGFGEIELSAALKVANLRCKEPLDDSEVKTIIGSVMKYEPNETIENLTDLGNAKRLVEIHGDKLRFCEDNWYIWNGKVWERDNTNKIFSYVEDVIKQLYREASQAKDSEERRQLSEHARRSESANSAKNLIFWAKSKLTIVPEKFDSDKELLNVNNGIINLRTGELLPHDSKFMMRKIIRFDYIPDSKCPKWLEFLNFVQRNDLDTIYWIQKALGLSISGRSDRVLPFLWGKGGNGKSVFSEVLLKLFGDYGQKTSIEAFSVGDFQEGGDKPNSYLARLHGARFVIANETREDGKLNVSLIKDLTGVDTITARDLYDKAEDVQAFTPTHTLWIYGNHAPKINDTTDSIWDRMCEIPFLVKIPDDVKKPLDEVVGEFLAEGEGILNWIVQGYQLWLNDGLKKTKTIEAATNEYRDEEDIFKQFINEECELGEGFTVSKDELISSFGDYCHKNGEKKASLTKSKITRRLDEMGIKDFGKGRKQLRGIQKIEISGFERPNYSDFDKIIKPLN